MPKKPHFIGVFTLLCLSIISCSRYSETKSADGYLDRLDACLNNANTFDNKKHNRINALKSKLNSETDEPKKWQTYMELGNEYRAFRSDSSTYFYAQACQLAENANSESQIADSRIFLAYARSTSGLFTLAYNTLTRVDTATLSLKQKLLYATVSRQLYSYMDEYAKGLSDSEGHNEYRDKGLMYEQFLIDNLDVDDPYRKFMYAQKLHRDGDNTSARKIAFGLLKELREDENLYGMSAYLMAQIAMAEGNDSEYGKYLTVASMSDVKAGVKETMALPALAKWLYNKGEVDRAYRYINYSLQDAMASNARMRTVEIASLLPLIDDSYRKKVSSSRDELMLYFALVVILFFITGALLVATFRNVKRVRAVNRKMAQQTKIQETYIGHFLGLCSSYSEKLESLRKLVNRKIAAGQTDELLKMLKSGKYNDPENDDFFKVFDATFLDLYPTFIDEFNLLLKPQERLQYKEGTPLSTELRIYAFVRLGVEESVKIAQIIHCSVSTIYTYRNRMRGRALNRETFEEDVMKIGRDNDLFESNTNKRP
ncbi:MAG: DUF6377 domain-containing protein [Muribaculaceae bacterium]|nr:DUF6377 domain-containing protein [Muribaculaceae bacterium]